MALGSLVVHLGLDAAEFTTALTKSEYQAKKFANDVKASFAGNLLADFAQNVISQFSRLPLALVDSIAAYKQLSEKIGASASSLSGLQEASNLSGVSLDTVAAASVRLTTALSKQDDESKGVGVALKAINIPLEEFKKLDPVSQLEAVAKKLAEFKDGAGKTAIAVALFGRSGAEALPFLNDLADAGGRNVRLTEEQIVAADRFTKQYALVKSEVSKFAQVVIAEAIPAFASLLKGITDVVNGSGKLGSSTVIADWAFTAARALAVLLESVTFVLKGIRALAGSFEAVFADMQLAGTFLANGGVIGLAFESTRKEMSDALEKRNKTVKEANARYVDLWNYDATAISKAIDRAQAASKNIVPDTRKDLGIPDLGGKGSKTKAFQDDAATKFLQTQREIEAVLRAQLSGEDKLGAAKKEQVKFEQMIADLKEKRTLTADQKSLLAAQDAIRAQLGQNVALEEQISIRARNLKREQEITEAMQKQAALVEKRKRDFADAEAAAQSYLDTLKTGFDRERQGMGIGQSGRDRLAGLTQIQDKYAQQLLQLESDRRKGMDDDVYTEELDRIRRFQSQALEEWDKHFGNIKELQQNGYLGMQDALADYLDNAANQFEQVKGLTENVFSGLEDVWVRFVTTGKLSFKEFSQSVIADVARMQAKMMLSKFLTGIFGSYDTGGLDSLIGTQSAKYPMATGTNYVPYDGFQASLHKGEAVIPKAYNPSAGGNGGKTSIVQNITIQGSPQMSRWEMERSMYNASVQAVNDKRNRGGTGW